MMKVAWAPTLGQWLGQTSGRSLGKAKLGSRDIFGGTSQRVFGSPRNSNYRTGKYSAGLFPSASVFENRRVLDSASLRSSNACLGSTVELFEYTARGTRTRRLWRFH